MTIKINVDSGIADITFDDETRSRASSRASMATLNSLAFTLPRSNSCFYDMHNDMMIKIELRRSLREAADFMDSTNENYLLAPAFGERITAKAKVLTPSKFSGFTEWWGWAIEDCLKEGRKLERERIYEEMKQNGELEMYGQLAAARTKRWTCKSLKREEKRRMFAEHKPTNKNRLLSFFNGKYDKHNDIYGRSLSTNRHPQCFFLALFFIWIPKTYLY